MKKLFLILMVAVLAVPAVAQTNYTVQDALESIDAWLGCISAAGITSQMPGTNIIGATLHAEDWHVDAYRSVIGFANTNSLSANLDVIGDTNTVFAPTTDIYFTDTIFELVSWIDEWLDNTGASDGLLKGTNIAFSTYANGTWTPKNFDTGTSYARFGRTAAAAPVPGTDSLVADTPTVLAAVWTDYAVVDGWFDTNSAVLTFPEDGLYFITVQWTTENCMAKVKLKRDDAVAWGYSSGITAPASAYYSNVTQHAGGYSVLEVFTNGENYEVTCELDRTGTATNYLRSVDISSHLLAPY